MTDSIFPKRPGSEAEQARRKFETAREILQEANNISAPILPTKEVLAESEKIRIESDKLISLLGSGINKTNVNKVDETCRNLGKICLNIQQMTIKYRVNQ